MGDQEQKMKINNESFDFIFTSQETNWDCGLACITMLLKYYECYSSATQELCETARNESEGPLWTIDLYCLLRDCGIHWSTMHTKCIGIHPNHSKLDWYKNHLDKDTERVEQKFLRAKVTYLLLNEKRDQIS